jgi:4-amino-4-deoxy-L-arabinose transferase-like glycosyltransferase
VTKSRIFVPTILAALSLLLNLLWVFTIQPFLAPDEPEHLAAIREIQRKRILPELHFDFTTNPRGTAVPPFSDPPFTDTVQQVLGTGARHQISFEAVQPPLYYLTAALISWPVYDNVLVQLYVCRIVSAIFGMLTILFIWATIREISPSSPQLALFCATTVLFLPQFTFNSSYVTNDAALNAVGMGALYVFFKGLRNPAFDRYMLLAGALVGLAILTKLTALALLLPFGLVILYRSRSQRPFFALTAGALFSFLAVSGWWFVRNIIIYGELSGFANAVQFHQARKSTIYLDLTNLQAVTQFSKTTFESTIGIFGWMDVPLEPFIYQVALLLATALSALSLYYLFRRIRDERTDRTLIRSLSILLLLAIGIIFGYLTYSLRIGYQAQGRYLFLLLILFTFLINYGLQKLAAHHRWHNLWYALPTLLLLVLNVYSLFVVGAHWV